MQAKLYLPKPMANYENVIARAINLLSKEYGGCTVMNATGYWFEEKMCEELVSIVECVSKDNGLAFDMKWLAQKAHEDSEESAILCVIDGEPYLTGEDISVIE